MKKIVMILIMLFMIIPMPVMALEEDKAMGDSYGEENSLSSMRLYGSSQKKPIVPSNSVGKGIDISHHNGDIDFKKLKKEVDFVIVRCGYGQNYKSQDDRKYEEYIKGCRDNNIPYGIYLYAHANTVDKAKSEGNHALRLVKKCRDWNTEPTLPIFYDMEDADQRPTSAALKGKIAKAFCDILEKAGYKTGVYANLNWWNNYLTDKYFNNTIKWVAQYNSSCKYKKSYAIWQCTSVAKISGVKGNVDLNYMIDNTCLKNNVFNAKVSEIDVQHYNGEEIKPRVNVKLDGKTLQSEKDYTLSYQNNVEIGTASVTINGKGKYVGKKTVTFTIDNYTPIIEGYDGDYDGKTHFVNVSNYKPGTEVLYSLDNENWSTNRPERIDVGDTKVWYKAINGDDKVISGSAHIKIKHKNISQCHFSEIGTQVYTGKAIVVNLVIKNGNVVLNRGIDYRLNYKNNTTAGKATIEVEGLDNYTGKKIVSFTIKKYDPKAKGYNAAYDGKAHSITVFDQKPGTKVKYSTNNKKWSTTKPTRTNVGTTKVYYQAVNGLNKTIKGSANIVVKKRSVSTCSISKVSNKTYTGKTLKPSISVKYKGKTLKKEKDYTVSYKNNKAVGTATITIKGKGNFNGTYKRTFKIVLKKPSITKITRTKKTATIKWSKIKGASGYQVAYRKKGSSKWSYKTVKSASKKLTGLTSKKNYYVKIRAYKTVKGKKNYSSFSATKSFKTR